VDSAVCPIDVDDPETWPAEVIDWVTPVADRLRGSTDYTGDLAVPIEREDEFRELLARALLAYHCTWLLDQEVEAIRRNGLRMLSKEFVEERIGSAQQSGALDERVANRLRVGNVYALEAHEGRDGRVCLVLGRAIFDKPSNGQYRLWRRGVERPSMEVHKTL
jgi:hypothetical protein